MSDKEKNFSRGAIDISESRIDTTQLLLPGGDVVVTVASAEPRCTEITKAVWNAYETHFAVKFSDERASGRKEEFASVLQRHSEKHCSSQIEVAGFRTTQFEEWASFFSNEIAALFKKGGRPLSITIDVSCLPKHYIVYLIGFVFDKALVSHLNMFYAEGAYVATQGDIASPQEINPYQFSLGDWTPLMIPYFEGDLALEKRTRIVASLGFEGFQSRTFIKSYQADRYAAIIPISSFSQSYDAIAERESKAFITELCVDACNTYRCVAGSAIEVFHTLEASFARQEDFHDVMMCLGTKPHAIGIALHGLIHRDKTIVCRLPNAYPENKTAALGISWSYTIIDRSAVFDLAGANGTQDDLAVA